MAQRDRSGTVERLKAAAITVWSERGYHAASVHEIAAEAQANVALVNRYFGSKQGLLLALVEELLRSKQSDALPYPPQPTLVEEVRCYLRFRLQADTQEDRRIRIIIAQLAVDAEFRHRAIASLEYAADSNFRSRLETLKVDGRLRPDTDIVALFRTISLFSFSAYFIEGFMLGVPAHETQALLDDFAATLAVRYATEKVPS